MRIKKILLVIMLLFMAVPVLAIDKPYLKGIKINGEDIKDFKEDKYEYEIHMDKTVEKVAIAPIVGDDCKFTTEGSLNPVLEPGENIIKIVVTNAEDNINPQTYTLKLIKEDTRSSDATLSSLTVGDKKVDLKENVFDYTVEIPNNVKTVEVKATLNNNAASFVQGYGERTGNNSVTLSGENTKVEIQVKAENGKTQTYKITIKKTDYKNNDAALKSLTIKEAKINFKSDTTSYDIEVDNEIEKVNLEAIPNDSKASVNYNKEITLKEGLNKVSIIVTAEDGTEKSYRLNITRKEKVNLVEKIEIEGIDLEFSPDIYEYDIETTLTTLNMIVTLGNKSATYEVLNNDNLENGSVVSLVVKNNGEELTYKFNIVNEETKPEEEQEEDNEIEPIETEKKEEKTSFLKKNEMLIGLLTFGVGIISMLFAVLTKFRNK